MITVLWTCHECGATKQKAFVRERRQKESVLHYMNEVAKVVGDAHSLYSILCHGRKADIMIPLSERPDAGIGER